MRWTTANLPDQTGKTAIVTGGNSGLGYYACRALAARGAQVILACRNQEKGLSAIRRIQNDFPHASLELLPLDLADLHSVHAFAFSFAEKHARLHILINNAGLMATPYRQTVDGFELQFGVNHLGHFALTGLLLDQLLAVPDARVVTVTSLIHASGVIDFDDLYSRRKYARWSAYARSKLANLLFAYELQRRLAGLWLFCHQPGCPPRLFVHQPANHRAWPGSEPAISWDHEAWQCSACPARSDGRIACPVCRRRPGRARRRHHRSCQSVWDAWLPGENPFQPCFPRPPGCRPPVVGLRRNDRRALRFFANLTALIPSGFPCCRSTVKSDSLPVLPIRL